MHRLFLALRLPRFVSDVLLDTMEGEPALNWQDAEQLHLTLRFVGEVERPVAEDLATALCGLRFAPFELRVAGVGRFDHHGRGALWAGVSPREPVAALAASVERICGAVGLPPERRLFHPHITLARYGRGAEPAVERFLAAHADLVSAPFAVDRVTLFESHLGHGGAFHEAIAFYPDA